MIQVYKCVHFLSECNSERFMYKEAVAKSKCVFVCV